MSLDLNQAVLGLQALSASVTTELFQLRQELAILERKASLETTELLGQTAVAQADAAYNETKRDADAQKTKAIGDLTGNVVSAGVQGAGEFKAKGLNDLASEAHTKVDTLKAQIAEKENQLGIRPAVGDAAPAAVGSVEEQAQVRKDVESLRTQLRDAQTDANHHENLVSQTRTQFQAAGTAMAGGISGSTGIAAAESTADKAKYAAALQLFSYMLQIVKSVADALNSMAQSQDNSVKDVAAMLQAQTAANHVSA